MYMDFNWVQMKKPTPGVGFFNVRIGVGYSNFLIRKIRNKFFSGRLDLQNVS